MKRHRIIVLLALVALAMMVSIAVASTWAEEAAPASLPTKEQVQGPMVERASLESKLTNLKTNLERIQKQLAEARAAVGILEKQELKFQGAIELLESLLK